MQLTEFNEKFKEFGMKHKINIFCSHCPKKRKIYKEKALENIKKNGCYLCRSCSMKKSHKDNPRSQNTKDKQRKGRLGKKHTEESKQKMSEAKLAFYKTEKGKKFKNKLSRLTAKDHSKNKFENSKRSGWYPSTKNNKPVFYGSSYELRLCYVLDQDESVAYYETQIEYKINNKGRCLDCLVTYKNGSKLAIEVKPESRLNEQANIEQIEDSKKNATLQGWNFKTCTELDFKMTVAELRDWADEFKTKIDNKNFNWIEFRKENNRKRAKKHYHKKIARNKTKFYCEYCKEDHEVLTITYNKNIKKNGKFVCHSENAHKPKPSKKKKENPYAAEGKKQCTECTKIKLFDEFGKDKSRRDGYSNKCKLCRSQAALKKYHKNKKEK